MPHHPALAPPSCRLAPTTLRKPDQAIAELAARQGGVVSQAQLVAAGLTPSAITRRVAAGRLHRLHRGVYAVGHTALPFVARLQAATLACGPQTVISSWSRAAVYELCPPRLPIHVPVSGGRGRRQPGLVIHGGALGPEDVVVRGGLRMTSWARTMLDIAADATLGEVVELLDRPRPSGWSRPRRCSTSSPAARGAAARTACATRSSSSTRRAC